MGRIPKLRKSVLEAQEVSSFLEQSTWFAGDKARVLPLSNVFLLREKTGRRIFLYTGRDQRRYVLKITAHEPRAVGDQPRPLNCLEEGKILLICSNRQRCTSIPEVIATGHGPGDWTFLVQPFYPHEGILSREQAEITAKKVLQVVQFLARKAILHRDIRLENLRIHGAQVMVIDFNRAIHLPAPEFELFDNSDVTARGPLIVPSHAHSYRGAHSFLSLIEAINARCGLNLSAANILRSFQHERGSID